MRLLVPRWTLVVSLALSISCVQEYAQIEVLPGSTVTDLTFTVGSRGRPGEPVSSMVVFRIERAPCPEDTVVSRAAVWLIHARNGVGPHPGPSSVAYGVTPDGYETDISPEPLALGCYSVSLSGDGVRGSAEFRVGENGNIEPVGT